MDLLKQARQILRRDEMPAFALQAGESHLEFLEVRHQEQGLILDRMEAGQILDSLSGRARLLLDPLDNVLSASSKLARSTHHTVRWTAEAAVDACWRAAIAQVQKDPRGGAGRAVRCATAAILASLPRDEPFQGRVALHAERVAELHLLRGINLRHRPVSLLQSTG